MSTSTLPTKLMDNWEQVRDDWVAEVERFIAEVETWCKRQDWACRRDIKTIVESEVGAYVVPQLLVQDTFGRLLFDPYARFVVGAEGLIDLSVVPSYHYVLIVRYPEGWFLVEEDTEGPRVAWSEGVFAELAPRLGRSA